MINTVIFDMDGVIVDTEPLHEMAFFKHFEELGIPVTKTEYDTYRGLSTRNVYEKLKENHSLQKSPQELTSRKREIFTSLFSENNELDLLPGVKNLIESLHTSGFQLILATSSARITQTMIFERFNLFPYFSHIVNGEDFPQSKPNPEIFLKAVELSGQPKENCIIIEDSINGVKAAHAANIFCIGYKAGEFTNQDLSLADTIINDFSQLSPEVIKQLV
ncbi:HAD family phosphatase [Apibacter sp. HY039]|uniref:HAD family hydrolase n=1 Tax=Apibacter sp. HY039 TaxID=2501476 RepID=UPI000FEB785F|nr:HAD family phosphatase [Apibacter sp. HY039]